MLAFCQLHPPVKAMAQSMKHRQNLRNSTVRKVWSQVTVFKRIPCKTYQSGTRSLARQCLTVGGGSRMISPPQRLCVRHYFLPATIDYKTLINIRYFYLWHVEKQKLDHSLPDTEQPHLRFLPTNRPACLYLRHPIGLLKFNNVSIVGSYSNSKKGTHNCNLPKTTLTRLSLAEPFIFWYSSFTGHLSMFLLKEQKELVLILQQNFDYFLLFQGFLVPIKASQCPENWVFAFSNWVFTFFN